MRIDSVRGRRKHGVAGIVASVILFAMLFTVGTSYFLFVNENNMLYSQVSGARDSAASAQLAENLLLTASAPSPALDVLLTIKNLGGIAVNVTALYVIDATSGAVLKFYQQGSSGISPSLPLVVNVGAVSSRINTGQLYGGGDKFIVKIVTQRGSTFSTNYPPTSSATVANALSSGAIGDLYLAFQSFTFYTLTTSGCLSGSNYSGYCLSQVGKAFSICGASSCGTSYSSTNLAFSVTITDLNNQTANIVLDPYTLLSLVPESGKGSLSYVNWYLVCNTSTAVYSTFAPIVLKYNIPKTVVFASAVAVVGSKTFGGSGTLQAPGLSSGQIPATTPIFIISHGCEGAGITTCTVDTANYGQNSPFVTTLFHS